MSENIKLWNTFLVEEKDRNAELKGKLTNSNKTSVWRAIYYTFAAGLSTLQDMWEEFLKKVQTKLDNQVAGTAPWYRTKALDYRTGVTFDEEKGEWSGDGTKIVAKCSVVDLSNKPNIPGGIDDVERRVQVKVLKAGDVVLTSAEVTGLQSYLDRVKFVGTNIEVQSNPIDNLKVELMIYRKAPVLAQDNVTTAVKDAIKSYVEALPFNGRFISQEMLNTIERVDNVDVVVLKKLQYQDELKRWIDTTEPWLLSLSGAFLVEPNNIKVKYGA